MSHTNVTRAEIQTLRAIARQAEKTDRYRINVALENSVGSGNLSQMADRLLKASLKLDGMVAVAEATALFDRVGPAMRRKVLDGIEPRDKDFLTGEVPVFYAGP